MNSKMIKLLYNGSVILLVVVVIAALIDATKLYDFGSYDIMQLAFLAATLWFILWQLKRNNTKN